MTGFSRRLNEKETRTRNQEIERLHGMGLTNRQISLQVHLTCSHTQKITSLMKKNKYACASKDWE